jgi:hypothetical protein
MQSIERINVINRNKLDEIFYFQSIIEEAYNCKLLTEADIERIQYQCLELLAYKTERYNGGDSSSVRIEIAESIMKSNLYTIGLQLKSFQNTDDAVEALKKTKVSELYDSGRECIETKLRAARHIYMLISRNKINTENYAYNATIEKGIKYFFKIYRPDYAAHETPPAMDYPIIDYPLCNPIKHLVGIEYVQKYLESLYCENMFLRCFSSDDIHHLLCGYDEGFRDLLMNIFEQVLTTAIGCKLAGIDAKGLNIFENKIEYLYGILSRKSNEEISGMILKVNEDLQYELSLKSISLQRYMEKSLMTFISSVCNAVKENTLDRVFISPKYPDRNSKIYFSFGEKMDNEQYRVIIDEIKQCCYLSDKIAIIKSRIQSLGDLEDLFLDADLSQCEIVAVLNELDITEIAALAKRYPLKSDIEAVDLRKSETELSSYLHNFIITQPRTKQERIKKLISLIDYDQQ